MSCNRVSPAAENQETFIESVARQIQERHSIYHFFDETAYSFARTK
jgi:hypothetical protein